MKTVGSYEARTHLYELLRDVENGESITVTRYGTAVARIVPVQDQVPKAATAEEDNSQLGSNTSNQELTEDERE